MIIYRDWLKFKRVNGKTVRYICEGYFLFGIIPLVLNRWNIDLPNH